MKILSKFEAFLKGGQYNIVFIFCLKKNIAIKQKFLHLLLKGVVSTMRKILIVLCTLYLCWTNIAIAKEVSPKGRHYYGRFYKDISLFVVSDKAERKKYWSLPGSFKFYADKNFKAVKLTGRNYINIKLGNYPAAVFFSKNKCFEINSPNVSRGDKAKYIKKGATNSLEVSTSTVDELLKQRNLAFNPYDRQESAVTFFPHATASSQCRNLQNFKAFNAIDGAKENHGHGSWPMRSWGPEKEEFHSLKIDFGRLVGVNQIKVTLRADFPHDDVWSGGKIKFSSGAEVPITFQKTGKEQIFSFPKHETTYVELVELKCPDKNKWYALSEIEVWGNDILFANFKTPDGQKNSFENMLLSFRNDESICRAKNFVWNCLFEKYPVLADRLIQDLGEDSLKKLFGKDRKKTYIELAQKAVSEIKNPEQKSKLSAELDNKKSGQKDLLKIYVSAAKILRTDLIKELVPNGSRKFVYVEKQPYQASFFAYNEAVSDARGESHFSPYSRLCTLEIDSLGNIKRTVLIEDKTGSLRDPDVSYDGTEILFSWKKSQFEDFQIYKMNLKSKKLLQLTNGKCANIEPKYLPNGDIVFNSTRCEQTVDCFFTDVSNLYIMASDGSFLRRVGYDQVHTVAPSLTENGNIIYTRWDYSDRGQTFTQGLFIMNPDGSFQRELYGNQSWYPTTIVHARQIPNTDKYVATLCGHHTDQRGKLAKIDPSLGMEEDSGITLLAPTRKEKPVRHDTYGQKGEQFQYPYPISEDLFVVTYTPISANNHIYPQPYGLYLTASDGRRTLLSYDAELDSAQAVEIAPRKKPAPFKSNLDYTDNTATLFIRNIYYGKGTEGVRKGSIKKVRVIKLYFDRRAPVGFLRGLNKEGGVTVGNVVSTPIALGQASWDAKEILGEVPVEPDGSVYFKIPARTPVYFQPIDENGNAVTTMRSWTSMQPGEFYSCMGCHGDRDKSGANSVHPNRKPQELKKFYDVDGGFSYRKVIQPILNKNCICCHNNRNIPRLFSKDGKCNVAVSSLAKVSDEKIEKFIKDHNNDSVRAFSLLDVKIENRQARREFNDSYYNLLQPKMHNGYPCYANFMGKCINWNGMQSIPTLLPPYNRGAAKSDLLKMLRSGHGKTKLSREELDKIAAWIDLYVPYSANYTADNIWNEREKAIFNYYDNKAENFKKEEAESLKKYLDSKEKN